MNKRQSLNKKEDENDRQQILIHIKHKAKRISNFEFTSKHCHCFGKTNRSI